MILDHANGQIIIIVGIVLHKIVFANGHVVYNAYKQGKAEDPCCW